MRGLMIRGAVEG